jgi:hypothetical protein
MAKRLISHAELLRALDYSPETGVFTWKIQASTRALVGSVAGSAYGDYWSVRYLSVNYLAHRLAWFYVNGEWPPSDLDHRDTDKRNNRISNLREADDSLNGANKRLAANNTSGAKGVRRRANNRWRASLEHGGKFISLGTYGSREEASAAYLAGAQKIFGDFARAA